MKPTEEGYTPSPVFVTKNPNNTVPNMYDIDTSSVDKNDDPAVETLLP